MRIAVIAVGRLKQGPERDLVERYHQRADAAGRRLGLRGLDIHELAESRAREPATRMAEEAAAIAALIPERAIIVGLDERGKNLDSAALARQIAAWRDGGAPDLVFVIGGADGLSPELRRKAQLVLAFGAATWPHQMARIMLMEQIYRATTILSGHPYHRA
ncbi:MAG: 23S rRNA (pseudouridine(1915)-N(3))-methyltransferase RlmH [Xanthobacteraceae bacterium]|nr:MAG: 23S rRNA (pseudouridine(1915)-N(3))-methyltransferase RlmH [Xanthobacteraceae bacterium]